MSASTHFHKDINLAMVHTKNVYDLWCVVCVCACVVCVCVPLLCGVCVCVPLLCGGVCVCPSIVWCVCVCPSITQSVLWTTRAHNTLTPAAR